jgi:hypothetical protein
MLALRALVDAAANTREFLVPFDLRRYAAVAAVAAFVGVRAGYGSVTNLAGLVFFEDGVAVTEPAIGRLVGSAGMDVLVFGSVVVVAAAYFSAVAEYVLVDILRTDEPRVRKRASDRIGDGARLFVFRFVVTASFVASIAVTVLGESGFAAPVAFAVFGVAVSLFNGFTTDFVVPVVVVRGCTLRRGWRVVARLARRRPRAFAGYAVARVVVSLAVAVGATVAALVVAAVYALPLAALSYAFGLTSAGLDAVIVTATGFVLLVVVAVVYVALVAASVALAVQLPVRLFVRSWSLYFLGEIDAEYALLDSDESLGT